MQIILNSFYDIHFFLQRNPKQRTPDRILAPKIEDQKQPFGPDFQKVLYFNKKIEDSYFEVEDIQSEFCFKIIGLFGPTFAKKVIFKKH